MRLHGYQSKQLSCGLYSLHPGTSDPARFSCSQDEPDNDTHNGADRVRFNVADVRDPPRDEELSGLDANRKSEPEKNREPPESSAEQQQKEQADRQEHENVGSELDRVVGDPTARRMRLKHIEHSPQDAFGFAVERLGTKRDPAHEGQVGNREQTENRVAVQHPSIVPDKSGIPMVYGIGSPECVTILAHDSPSILMTAHPFS